jgi:hypothetical protein
LGTSKEHDENMLGTHWEQGRKTKNNCPNPKRKKQGRHIMSACYAFALAA